MLLSILIPTIFHRPEMMDDLLESLANQKEIISPFEVLIIDNNLEAKVEIQKIIPRWQEKLNIRIVHAPENGLHHARHTGAQHAHGDVLVYIDDDIRAQPGWLAAYQSFFEDQDVLCAGGKVLPEWETQPPDWINSVPDEVFSLLDYGDQIRPLNDKEGINGCNFAIRKEAVFAYGGFHPDGFSDPHKMWYRGDGEYGLIQKIKQSGQNVHYLPQAALFHRIPAQRMSLASVQKIVKDHAISQAYSYARTHRCSQLSILALILGGKILEIRQRLSRPGYKEKIIASLKAEKFQTISRYGLELIRQSHLREHVLQKDYLPTEGKTDSKETSHGF